MLPSDTPPEISMIPRVVWPAGRTAGPGRGRRTGQVCLMRGHGGEWGLAVTCWCPVHGPGFGDQACSSGGEEAQAQKGPPLSTGAGGAGSKAFFFGTFFKLR